MLRLYYIKIPFRKQWNDTILHDSKSTIRKLCCDLFLCLFIFSQEKGVPHIFITGNALRFINHFFPFFHVIHYQTDEEDSIVTKFLTQYYNFTWCRLRRNTSGRHRIVNQQGSIAGTTGKFLPIYSFYDRIISNI